MWLKRYDGQWSWVTVTVDASNNLAHFYLNGSEVDSKAGHGSPSPLRFNGKLKPYGNRPIYLGSTPSQKDGSPIKYLKGDIAKVFAWKKCLTPEQVSNLHNSIPQDDLVVDLDFNNPISNHKLKNIEFSEKDIRVPNSIIPHRKEGRMRCLHHDDEGLVNGKWAKGETTAANEKRYVLQMQQDKINYKKDGIAQVKYELVSEEKLTPWAKMLNIKL